MEQNLLYNCCQNVLNNNQRVNNENEIVKAYNYDPLNFIGSVVTLISTDTVNESIKQFCCTLLKNIISNRVKGSLKDVWMSVDNNSRNLYKNQLFALLGSDSFKIRSGISSCISAICCEEFKHGQWFEIISTLISISADTNLNYKLSALTTLKNIAQDSIPGIIPMNYLGDILFTVMNNVSENIDIKVQVEALQILGNLIQSCKEFMQDERKNMIFDICIKALGVNSEEIHLASFKCIYELCKCYYFEIKDHVAQIVNLATMFINSINKLPDDTKLFTLILDSLICLSETEVFLMDKNWNCNYYFKYFKSDVINLCYKIFTIRNSEEYEDDYLPHHSAATLLENLVAINDYDVVELILGQITELLGTNIPLNIDNALILFYCILDTRKPENKEKLAAMLTESYNTIIGYISHESQAIKITTAKIISKVAKKYFLFLNELTKDLLLDTILKTMDINFKPIQIYSLRALINMANNFDLMMDSSKFFKL